MVERDVLVQSKRDLVRQNSELCSDRVRHFTGDQTEGDAKGMAGAKNTDDDVEKLFAVLKAELS